MNRFSKVTAAGAVMAVLALTACAPPAPVGLGPPGPRSFQYGYSDGCGDGYNVAGSPIYAFNRLEEASAPKADGVYQTGWKQGFLACRRSYDRMQKTLHLLFGPL